MGRYDGYISPTPTALFCIMNTNNSKQLEFWKDVNGGLIAYLCVLFTWLAMAFFGWNSHMQPLSLERSREFPYSLHTIHSQLLHYRPSH